MPRCLVIFFLFAATLGVSVPLTAQASTGTDRNGALTQKLLQLEADFAKATAERGGEGFASFFADNAVTFPQNGKIATGKPKGNWKPADFELTWQPVKAEASGDLGYTYGYYQSRSHTPQGDVVHEGKYTTIWQKQKDGAWKVVLDIGNEGSNQEGTKQ